MVNRIKKRFCRFFQEKRIITSYSKLEENVTSDAKQESTGTKEEDTSNRQGEIVSINGDAGTAQDETVHQQSKTNTKNQESSFDDSVPTTLDTSHDIKDTTSDNTCTTHDNTGIAHDNTDTPHDNTDTNSDNTDTTNTDTAPENTDPTHAKTPANPNTSHNIRETTQQDEPVNRHTTLPGYLTKTRFLITTVIIPCIIIFLDMGYSDLLAIISLYSFQYQFLGIALTWCLIVIYAISIVFMLLSPIISSLKTSYRTAVDLSDTSLEKTGAELSLGIYFLFPIAPFILLTGSLSRYDFSLEECTESSLQAILQLTTYLALFLYECPVDYSPYFDYSYNIILRSYLLSACSLTIGQVKVKINTTT